MNKHQASFIALLLLKTTLIAAIANFALLLSVQAQTLTNSNAGITIENGITLTVQGDILTQAGGSYDNAGIVELSGNWTNNSGSNAFGISQGTVVMNGALQWIDGNSITVFNNLILQPGTNAKLMTNCNTGGANALPAGILNIGAGTLELNQNTLTVNNNATNAIIASTGGIISEQTDNSSKVAWHINNTTGNHLIPFITTANVQIPFTFNQLSGDAGIVTVATYPTNTVNLPYPVTPVTVTHVRNNFGFDNSANTADRFWQIDKTGLNTNATYTFTIAPGEAPSPGAALIAQHWSPAPEAWDLPIAGQNNPTTLSVTVPGINLNGAWALSLTSSPLPIELLSFKARAIENKFVETKWTVTMEQDNDHFEIERSHDGVIFEFAGYIPSLGNTAGLRTYLFNDLQPFNGFSYYRLKQVDINGNYSYSKTETVLISSDNKLQLSCFPNPSKGQFNLLSTARLYRIEIYNASGQKVYERLPEKDVLNHSFDLMHLGKGIYILNAFDGLNQTTMRIAID